MTYYKRTNMFVQYFIDKLEDFKFIYMLILCGIEINTAICYFTILSIYYNLVVWKFVQFLLLMWIYNVYCYVWICIIIAINVDLSF